MLTGKNGPHEKCDLTSAAFLIEVFGWIDGTAMAWEASLISDGEAMTVMQGK